MKTAVKSKDLIWDIEDALNRTHTYLVELMDIESVRALGRRSPPRVYTD